MLPELDNSGILCVWLTVIIYGMLFLIRDFKVVKQFVILPFFIVIVEIHRFIMRSTQKPN
jgi:hypothetical protein